MKTKAQLVMACLLLFLPVSSVMAAPVPQLMNYHGALADNSGNPVTGNKIIVFSLYSSATDTLTPAVWTETQTVAITSGSFNVLLGSSTTLPASVFDNEELWLGIAVGIDQEMSPRQRITSVGYAMRAGTADSITSTANVTADNPIVSNVPTGTAPFQVSSTTVVPNLNADMVDGIHASSLWQTGGNAGTVAGTDFIGTADMRQLDFRANNEVSLRIQPTNNFVNITTTHSASPNIIGGWRNNSVAGGVVGATISGGGGTINATDYPNRVLGLYGTIGGGISNTVGVNTGLPDAVLAATVAGGQENKATASLAVVGGGYWNTASGADSTVGGGFVNTAGVLAGATVAGGIYNKALGYASTVPGGIFNTAGADFSLAAGRRAVVRDPVAAGNVSGDVGTFVWADSQDADFSSSAANQFLIRASNGVGINTNTPGATLDVNGLLKTTTVSVGTGTGSYPASLYVQGNGFPQSFMVLDTISANQDAGIRFHENGTAKSHLFWSSSNGTLSLYGPAYKGMDISTAGNVGINTNTPAAALDVNGQVVIDQKNFGGNAGLLVKGGNPGANYPNIGFSTQNTNGIDVYVAGVGANLVNNTAGQEASDLAFHTATAGASAERMMITSTGNVGIGTSAPNRPLHIANPTAAEVNLQTMGGLADWKTWNILVDGGGGAKQNLTFRILNDAGTAATQNSLVLWNNGDATIPGTFTASSDVRLKTDIQPLEGSLAKVLRLRGVSYRMKDDDTNTRRIGVIAQEIEQEYPELVLADDKGMKSVAYANLTPVLIEAVKALKAENDDLRKRIEDLEAKMGK